MSKLSEAAESMAAILSGRIEANIKAELEKAWKARELDQILNVDAATLSETWGRISALREARRIVWAVTDATTDELVNGELEL